MKLLLYSHYFAPSIGGVETIVQGLASGLAELRDASGAPEFEVALVTQTPAGDFADASLPVPVVRRPGFLGLLARIRAADVVHLAGPAIVPLFASLVLRKRVVLEHHGFHAVCPNGQLFYEPTQSPCPGHFMAGRHRECLRCNAAQGALASAKLWLTAFLRRFLAKRSSANVTPTAWLGEVLALPRTKSIFHGIPAPNPAVERGQGGVPVVVFQGRLVSTKGARILLEAARNLLQRQFRFELHIIGGGPQRETLAQLTREWGLEPAAQFLGPLAAAELDRELERASVVVVPSQGGEVFGLVVAENMFRGLPVVASNLGAFVEVIGDAGIVFRTGDAADLAQRLAELLGDPVARENLGMRARTRAARFFARDRMIEAHASLYRNLVGAKR